MPAGFKGYNSPTYNMAQKKSKYIGGFQVQNAIFEQSEAYAVM